MRIILDCDILVYEAACRAERTIKWQDGMYTTVAYFDHATNRFKDLVKMWVNGARTKAMAEYGVGLEETSSAEMLFCFSNPDRSLSYRKGFELVAYKNERAGMKRPVVCADLEAWAIEEYNGIFEPTLEGDDICGLMVVPEEESIIITHDKDLLQIPGARVFKPRDQSLTDPITQEEGDRFFFTQVLTGDRVDGYHGVPGIGPVKAKSILAGLETDQMWEATVAAYKAKGLGEQYALETARVARILRGDEYDFDTQEVTLWTPGSA